MKQRVVIIGAGLGGLATACLLAKAGYYVTVLEKNEQLGGRAGSLKAKDFTFDTGPSWYLMPDVFEHFFTLMGENIADHLRLVKLDPGFRIFYKDTGMHLDITPSLQANMATFEQIEPGAGKQLQKYLDRARRTYETAVHDFSYKNYDRAGDLIGVKSLQALRDIPLLSSMHHHVARHFRDPRLQKILLYPSVFLGVSPYKAPALYSMLSHADFTQGVYYPMGGMYSLTEALVSLGRKHGVRYRTNCPVGKIVVKNGRAAGVLCRGKEQYADIVVSNADIYHTENQLLAPSQRDHTKAYWQHRTLAPSALLLYLGVDKQYPSLAHHNLLFSKDWRRNFAEIYDRPQFPTDPSLYVCAPGKTDPSVAPKGKENLFVLVPVAAGLRYTPKQLERFTERTLATIEQQLDLPGLRQSISYQKVFAVRDFAERFNSMQGTGLGLAHTLRQTALFRPGNISKKVEGLYYTGANVHPGIGMPSTFISAELVYKRLTHDRSSTPLASLLPLIKPGSFDAGNGSPL
ncbi:MAG TPA: phytoene desaturase family protein [Candidatus Saccharimonadales bacterium]|jgi:phytoene desaturase|nr:phytoene desaturase family protein [Candidatus Saccharimonadales bacterium]